jgi:predicted ATPase/DNA-binding winged helix-turn-helix (wHTH) protein/tRNA A37 threonylcarbamoyladenosine biosynthesis protein TsaE
MLVLRRGESVQHTVQAIEAKATGGAMQPGNDLTFGPFRLDVTQGQLWRGAEVLALRRRSLAMLRYLVEHPGRLVTKAELRQHVWAGTYITDTVLRVCVQEIRAVLGDSAATPRFLETVGRQGYRFLVADDQEDAPLLLAEPLVGRQREVDALMSWFQRAAQGARQLVFVSGEAGAGKTTLVDQWLARLATGRGVRMARGQCVEHYGEGEPYLPLLEALGQLSRGLDHREVLDALRRYAPMWLVQWPGLLPETELQRLQHQLQGATSARMLRELADVLDVLTAETPLVLVLEDLHWSDRSTVECLNYVAQRRVPARLLVLGTYRPVEAAIQQAPLSRIVRELCGRGYATEMRLELLTSEDVTAYLTGRLGGAVSARLAAFVYERTEGHALFLVNIVQHLVGQGVVVRREGQWTLQDGAAAKVAGLPEGLRQLLVRGLEDLPSEGRRVLEAASVAGERFTVAAVAAGAQCPVEDVEAQCEGLAAQHHFLEDIGLREWPDGTSSGRYRFVHALYRQVLYEGLGTARRRQLHQRIGVRLEAGYGAQACEIAARLAVHFERGGEIRRAVDYWQQAGDNAARRNAYPEAIAALRTGLALLARLPDSSERTQRELALQLMLGELLMVAKGMASLEAGEAYSRAYTLCQQVEESHQLFWALWGLIGFHNGHGRLRTGEGLGRQLFDLAQRQQDPVLVQASHLIVGGNELYLGNLVAARTHLEQSLEISAVPRSSSPLFAGRLHPRITSYAWILRPLWQLGYADQAQQRCQEALALAQQLGHTPSLALVEYFAAALCQFRQDAAATYACADALMTLADTQGFGLRLEQGRMLRGWALAMQGDAATGVAHIRHGLVASEGVGPETLRPHWLALLAEAYAEAGQPEAGLTVIDEALTLVATTETRWWEAELSRLKGALLLQLPSPEVPQAEACFQQAIDVARRQQAKALELRAALSLSRLWQLQGKREAAHALLEPIYAWFTEGFDTADLQEAKALLEAS